MRRTRRAGKKSPRPARLRNQKFIEQYSSIVEFSLKGTHDGEVLRCALVEIESRTLTPSVCHFSSDQAASPSTTADGLFNNVIAHEDGECGIEVEVLATGYVETVTFSMPYTE